MTVSPEAAEGLAVRALLWLSGDPERMAGFLGATGANAADLRGEARDPAFLGAVLDYVLAADESVLDFAAAEGLRPEMVAEARAALPGGADPHWT
ncbi:MAG: DUF3572 domain-containing protein [Pseudomonadota bacterium]